jgi:hypothetical protein
MKKNILFLSLFIGLLISNKSLSQTTNTNNNYTFKSGDYNGIGKWYMGREITHVMGYLYSVSRSFTNTLYVNFWVFMVSKNFR